jgi:hypothetical protein
MRLIAFSRHRGEFDALRERSVLMRETPPEGVKWMSENGVFEATAPVRVPALPEIGADARVLAPIRWQGDLVGVLAVLDPESSMSEAQLERAHETTERLATLLHRMLLMQRGVLPRERELVDTLLLAEQPATRAEAGGALAKEGYLSAGPVLVTVVDPPSLSPSREATDQEVLWSEIVVRVKRTLHHLTIAATTVSGQCVFVLALDRRKDLGAGSADLALRIHGCLTPIFKSQRRGVLVTYGKPAERWADASRSYRQATMAVRIARRVPSLGPVADWAQLGVYQTLAQLAPEYEPTDADQRLESLLEKRDLVLTLETYLDVAGDAKRAAEQLNVHRASLYYRLNRIEEILSIDLKQGGDRLMVHLALRMLRLRGRLR